MQDSETQAMGAVLSLASSLAAKEERPQRFELLKRGKALQVQAFKRRPALEAHLNTLVLGLRSQPTQKAGTWNKHNSFRAAATLWPLLVGCNSDGLKGT